MTKKQALEILELSGFSDDEDILMSWRLKYIQSHKLFISSREHGVRVSQEEHMMLLREIKAVLKIRDVQDDFYVSYDLGKLTRPIAAPVQMPSVPPPPQQRSAPPQRPSPPPVVADEVPALLVLHTEGRQEISFDLKKGQNFIGRNGVNGMKSDEIKKDLYISRNQCIIEIGTNKGEDIAILIDDNRNGGGKPSTNGTYLNGNKQRVVSTKLSDADTIQIGKTKLVFKWKSGRGTKEIETVVKHTGFIKTVDFLGKK